MFRSALFTVLIGSFVLSTVAYAERPSKRGALNQHRRIEQGIKSGKLTPEEAQQLKEEQKNIKNMKAKAKADGVVTKEEKMQIRQARKQASEHIYKEKHD
jgi:hypothetical protein